MVESEQLQMDVAGRLKEMTAALGIPFIFKSSYDKANRSSGSSFRGPGESLFHFDVERIDALGLLIRAEPSFPLRLSSRRFALARLKSELASYAPEYVFSRAAFDRAGRFQPLPRAWCADDAMWVALAASGCIQSFAQPRIQWRYSGSNISSNHEIDGPAKVVAAAQFIRWLEEFLRQNPAGDSEPQDDETLEAARF